MSTSRATIEFIEDQLAGLPIRTRPMFGEYGIYCDDKIVGLICNDTLFIKPAGIELPGTHLAPPYAGAKDYHAVPGDLLENADWLQRAIRSTADALPVPQPKKAKGAKR
jgi:TfoX/Sxy family transcriptional regulator of competence genes